MRKKRDDADVRPKVVMSREKKGYLHTKKGTCSLLAVGGLA